MIITDDQQWPVEAAEPNPFSANNRSPDQPERGPKEEPVGGAWKLVCFRDKWQQLCRDLDLCDDKLATAAAELASDSMPLGKYEDLYPAFRKVFLSLEALSRAIRKVNAGLRPKLEAFTSFVRKYEEEAGKTLLALQKVEGDVARATQERDHAAAMYKQEVQYRGRVQSLAEAQRRAKNEAVLLLDGMQRDRDRLLLLAVIEKEDATAVRRMVEDAQTEQKRAEEVSKVDRGLKHDAEGVAKDAKKMRNTITRELDKVRREKLQLSKALEKEEQANREFASSGNENFTKIQGLQAQLKDAADARADAIGRIQAAEDAATEAKTKQRADMRVRQQLDLDAEDAENQMKEAEDMAAAVAERAN
ncbi:LPXTG-motif cell wall anchor domain protein, partial [Perkinsus olseni]